MDCKYRVGQQLTRRKSGAPAMVVARQDSLVATFYTLFFHEDGGNPTLVTLHEPDVEAAFMAAPGARDELDKLVASVRSVMRTEKPDCDASGVPSAEVSPDIEAMFAHFEGDLTANGVYPRHSAEEAEMLKDVAAETGKGLVSVARDFAVYRRKKLTEAEQ